MIDFVETLANEADADLLYEIVPFKRSLLSVSAGRADMHVPLLQPDESLVIDEKLMYSEAALFEVPFYIYMAAGSDVSASLIGTEGIVVETDIAHTHFFPFPIVGSDCLECSLEKLALGRIDAFIYAEDTTERSIEKLGLGLVLRRKYYKTFPVKAVLPRTQCGEILNRKLNEIVPRARRASSHPVFRLDAAPVDPSN